MHLFLVKENAVNFALLLSKPNLGSYVKAAFSQAKTPLAFEKWDLPQFMRMQEPCDEGVEVQHTEGDFCPAFFGASGDWFCLEFLNYFGSHFQIEHVRSLTDSESTESDIGIDMHAVSSSPGKFKLIVWVAGSPVEIQIKWSVNPMKNLELNRDRIGNFGSAVANRARRAQKFQSTRMVLVTSAAGVNHSVLECLGEELEVINFVKISKLVDGNIGFWNHLRSKVGLSPLPYKELMDKE